MNPRTFLMFLNLIAISFAIEWTPDYTWKVFDGKIPEDAFIAGLERNIPIYVGRTVYQDLLIPGKLYKDDQHIYFEANGHAIRTKGEITILCTKHPDRLEWIPTNIKNYDSIRNQHLVLGGYEPGHKVYIGRTNDPEGVNVGKVICQRSSCLGLVATKRDRVVKYFVYDVLSYIPDLD